jgi:hypothetical protein
MDWKKIALMHERALEIINSTLNEEKIYYDKKDVEIHIVMQMFGSTAGPFGGFGGSAMTKFPIFICDCHTADIAIVMISPERYKVKRSGSWIW